MGASGGYDLAFDLNGADTWSVAYADIAIVESDEVTTCSKLTAECTTTGSTTITDAEVGWDALGSVWTADLGIEPGGLVEVEATAYDRSGKRLPAHTQIRVTATVHFVDDWQGETMVAADDDPNTSVAIIRDELHNGGTEGFALTVISEGWTAGSTLPASAQVELTDGETLTIPANSYQFRMRKRPEVLYAAWESEVREYIAEVSNNPLFHITINGGNLTIDDVSELTLDNLGLPVCVEGTCIQLIEGAAGEYSLAVTAYTATGTAVPADVEIGVALVDKEGTTVLSETVSVAFDDQIEIVFANAVGLSGDPIGVDLAGEVSLLGAASSRGKRSTLSKGKFYGQFTRDDGGNLRLAGADKNAVSPKGDILIGGEPIDFELTDDTDGDGVISAPPVVLMKNGTGTRNTASNTSQTQQAQLL